MRVALVLRSAGTARCQGMLLSPPCQAQNVVVVQPSCSCLASLPRRHAAGVHYVHHACEHFVLREALAQLQLQLNVFLD